MNPKRAREPRRTFDERCTQLTAFIAEHHRFPIYRLSRVRPGGDAWIESSLAAWMYAQRAFTLTDDNRSRLDAAAPGWKPVKLRTTEEAWAANAESIRAFRAGNGRWPSKDNGPADERKLGIWLINQRSLVSKGYPTSGKRPPAERVAHLDRLIPGWRPAAPVVRPTWDESLRVVAALWSELGRKPSPTAENADERFAGMWVHRQRNAWRHGDKPAAKERPLTSEQLASLDRLVPEWTARNRRR